LRRVHDLSQHILRRIHPRAKRRLHAFSGNSIAGTRFAAIVIMRNFPFGKFDFASAFRQFVDALTCCSFQR
jgi:hypothetical protein